MLNINHEYANLLSNIMQGSDTPSPRGFLTKELLAHQSIVSMSCPMVTSVNRRIGNRFRFAEAAWILSGDNRVETIKPFSRQIGRFSDDGVRYFGSYGPKIVDQLAHVTKSLRDDPDTRQAVINIWRENPRGTKDVPCTLSLQFINRHNVLHCIATMRSSDAWLGWPYDVFNFSCVAKAVIIELRQAYGIHLKLGMLFLTAGSQHLYSTNFSAAKEVIDDPQGPDSTFTLAASDLQIRSVTEFCDYLWEFAHSSKTDD